MSLYNESLPCMLATSQQTHGYKMCPFTPQTEDSPALGENHINAMSRLEQCRGEPRTKETDRQRLGVTA